MITNATISVIGVLIILMTACGYYAVPARKLPGRRAYIALLGFALMHLVGDGVLRTQFGEPLKIEIRALNGVGMLYFTIFLIGLIGVLQMVINIVWVKTRTELRVMSGLLLQVPALALAILTIVVRGGFAAAVLRYAPLLYALILFFATIWFYEKLDRGVRIGMLVAMIGCVIIFIMNSVLHISQIPLLVPVLLVVLALSWDGRGDLVLSDVSDEELERLHEKGYVGVESEEEPEEASEEGARTVIVTDRVQDTAMLPELEQMMRAREKAGRGKLSLEDELGAEQSEETAPTEIPAETPAEAPVEAVAAETEVPVSAAPVDDVMPGGMTPVQPIAPSQPVETVHIREEDIMAAGMRAVEPAGMRAVEPTPMEQLTAATALTAESDSQSEDAMQLLSQVDETISDVLHNRPLILEKDLNEYYHRMKNAIKDKDHDTCLEILSEMSEYRISGIHVTRYERIRHAVMDQEWKAVEKELKDF